jgi:cell division protein FtsX
MYSLKLALRPWRLSPLSQWMSAMTLGILLFLFSFLGWFSNALDPILAKLSSDQVLTAYLDVAEGTSGEKITDQIKIQLGSSANRVEYVNSDGFISELGKLYPDLAREVSSLGQEMKVIAPEYVSIRGQMDPQQVEKIKGIKGVESIDSSIERFKPISESLMTTQFVSRLFLVAALFGLLTVLFLMSRLNASIHQEARRLIYQLGGTRLQARIPQVFHQTFLGVLGGLIAATAWLFSQSFWVHKIQAFSPYFRDLAPASSGSTFWVIAMGAILGFLSGWMNPQAGEV